MKLFNHSLKIILPTLLLLLTATAASAQDAARLRFERLNGLETRAEEVVEVNIDGKLLDLAKRVSHINGIFTFFARYFVFKCLTTALYSPPLALAVVGARVKASVRKAITNKIFFLFNIIFTPF